MEQNEAARADVQRFGDKIAGQDYKLRPGSYAIIRDDSGRVAVLKCAQGFFLPGGGAEPGETAEQTLSREVREECGREVKVQQYLGKAHQFVFSALSREYFEKICTFFEATFDGRVGQPSDPDGELFWMAPAEAAKTLSHGSQVWAVSRACGVTLELSSMQ